MKRRSIFAAPVLALFPNAVSGQQVQPWSVRLLKGGFDGQFWWMGFAISLQPHWKTYWRIPGDGGIAPQFDLTGKNLKTFTPYYPLPQRFNDATGSTIGYKQDVVFPCAIAAEHADQSIDLEFRSFFGVCDTVCIPAQFAGNLTFDPSRSGMEDQIEIMQWKSKVPKADTVTWVQQASVQNTPGNMELKLTLAKPVRDIFVEGQAMHYFGAPQFSNSLAVMAVHGAKSVEDLKAAPLRLTIDTGQTPIEQTIAVT